MCFYLCIFCRIHIHLLCFSVKVQSTNSPLAEVPWLNILGWKSTGHDRFPFAKHIAPAILLLPSYISNIIQAHLVPTCMFVGPYFTRKIFGGVCRTCCDQTYVGSILCVFFPCSLQRYNLFSFKCRQYKRVIFLSQIFSFGDLSLGNQMLHFLVYGIERTA